MSKRPVSASELADVATCERGVYLKAKFASSMLLLG